MTKQAKQGDPVERAEQHVEQVEAKLEADQAELVTALGERAQVEQQQRQAGEGAVIKETIERLQAAAEPDPARVGYTVGVWGDRPYYRSNDGRFDTFDEQAMRAYVREQMV